jgi:hypothetical protein
MLFKSQKPTKINPCRKTDCALIQYKKDYFIGNVNTLSTILMFIIAYYTVLTLNLFTKNAQGNGYGKHYLLHFGKE